MRKRTKARECALQVLYQIDIASVEPSVALDNFWPENTQAQDIKEFASGLVLGASRHRQDIDAVIGKYAENWTVPRMAVVDRNILRMAAYELLQCPDIPPKVVINEAVDLAKKFGDAESGKFVNGILDKIHKENPKNGQAR